MEPIVEQYFTQGDKVVRVMYADEALPTPKLGWRFGKAMDKSKIYCVENVRGNAEDGYSRICLVGIDYLIGDGGHYAFCFRKVEDIKLIKELLKEVEQLNGIVTLPFKYMPPKELKR